MDSYRPERHRPHAPDALPGPRARPTFHSGPSRHSRCATESHSGRVDRARIARSPPAAGRGGRTAAEHDHLSWGDDLSPPLPGRPSRARTPLQRGLLRYGTPFGLGIRQSFRLRRVTPRDGMSWSRPCKKTAIAVMAVVGGRIKRRIRPTPPSTSHFSPAKPRPQRQWPFFYSSPIPDRLPRTIHAPPRRPPAHAEPGGRLVSQ